MFVERNQQDYHLFDPGMKRLAETEAKRAAT